MHSEQALDINRDYSSVMSRMRKAGFRDVSSGESDSSLQAGFDAGFRDAFSISFRMGQLAHSQRSESSPSRSAVLDESSYSPPLLTSIEKQWTAKVSDTADQFASRCDDGSDDDPTVDTGHFESQRQAVREKLIAISNDMRSNAMPESGGASDASPNPLQ